MNVKNLALGFMGFIVRAAILAVAVMAIIKTGKTAYDFGFRIFTEEPMSPEPGRDVAVTIVQGDSTMDIAELLEETGLIRDAKLFYVQKMCSEYNGDIKPGFYTLNTSMTAEDMFALIAGKEGEEPESEEAAEDESQFEVTPLTEEADSTPLDDVTGSWEGSEDDSATETIEVETESESESEEDKNDN